MPDREHKCHHPSGDREAFRAALWRIGNTLLDEKHEELREYAAPYLAALFEKLYAVEASQHANARKAVQDKKGSDSPSPPKSDRSRSWRDLAPIESSEGIRVSRILLRSRHEVVMDHEGPPLTPKEAMMNPERASRQVIRSHAMDIVDTWIM